MQLTQQPLAETGYRTWGQAQICQDQHLVVHALVYHDTTADKCCCAADVFHWSKVEF